MKANDSFLISGSRHSTNWRQISRPHRRSKRPVRCRTAASLFRRQIMGK